MITNIVPDLPIKNSLQSKQKLWNFAAAFLVFGSLVISAAILFFLFPLIFDQTSLPQKNNSVTITPLPPLKNSTTNVTEVEDTKQTTENGTNTRNETLPPKENLCTSDHCLEAVSNLKSNMNESSNPCEDFYTYACGGWIHEREMELKTLNRKSLSVFEQMDMENKKNIRNLLENLDSSLSSYEAEKKAKTFYDSCVHEKLVKTDCTVETMEFFPEVTSKLFVDHEFLTHKESLENLTIKIIQSFRTMSSKFSWIDNGTLHTFQNNFEYMLKISGYFENIMNTSQTDNLYQNVTVLNYNYYGNKVRLGNIRDNFGRDATKSGAYYGMQTYKHNKEITFVRDLIFIAAGLARRPKFDKTYPSVLNFAGIGSIVGHELGHSFVKFFTKVMEPIPLKTVNVANTVLNFNNVKQCVENYYNNRTWTNVQWGEKIKVNGSLTYEDNIADILGLQIAFKSFLEFGGVYAPLAGLEKFSKEQIFFIASAQGWCRAFVDRAAAKWMFDYQARNDVHSPNFVRVMGSFANSPDFVKTFNCPLDSAYNPETKCLF